MEAERRADRERTWLSWLDGIEDPRMSSKITYPLSEILLVALVSVLCGEEGTCEGMHRFGEDALPFFRRILPFASGIPSADTYWRVLSNLNSKAFASVLLQWQQQLKQSLDTQLPQHVGPVTT